jgi:acetolactate synthase regulatory subunit
MPTTDALIIADVHDRPGVLARMASMFYRRGLNVRTLNVQPTERPEISRVTVRLAGPRRELARLVPAIGNLVDILDVTLSDAPATDPPLVGPGHDASAEAGRSGPTAPSTCANPSAHAAPAPQRRHSDHSDERSKGAA